MTGYQSKRTAALDEEGMYLVHQTDHQGKHMTKDKTLKLALEVNESMKDVLKQVNELIAENKALKEALAQPAQQEPVAFAGIEMWVGNTKIKLCLTQMQLHNAKEPWMLIEHMAEMCISKLKEKNNAA